MKPLYNSSLIDYLCSKDEFLVFLQKGLDQSISAFEMYREFERFRYIGEQHQNELNTKYETQADFFDSSRG